MTGGSVGYRNAFSARLGTLFVPLYVPALITDQQLAEKWMVVSQEAFFRFKVVRNSFSALALGMIKVNV